MLWITAISLFFVVLIVLYIFIRLSAGDKPPATLRLHKYENQVKDNIDIYADEELSKPLHERLIYPFLKKIGDFLGKLAPQTIYTMFEEKLAAAGGFRNMTTNSFLLFWVAMGLVISFACALVAGNVFRLPANQIIGVFLLGLVIAMILPLIVLERRILARKALMQKSLPGVLDLIYVSVQAGLSFDGAIAKVVEKMHGPLAEEFARMHQEIRIGATRRAALKNLADRCKVQDISLFTAALIQADQLGVSIANVLKIQASNVRMKRQLTIRELALKAPVKMLMPLVFFIFPTIFVVLLGPGMIAIIRQFVNR